MSEEKAVEVEPSEQNTAPGQEDITESAPLIDTTDDAAEAIVEEHVDSTALQTEVDQLRARVAEQQDALLRSRAELDNLRKRAQRDVEKAHKYAVEQLAQGLLPVIDSLELGLNAADTASDIASLKEGMTMTLNMFSDTLDKHGLQAINPEGEKFDPEQHQAMTLQENDEVEPNTVLSVMQKGYTLNERLVRPAMVVVSKKPDTAS